MPEYKIVGAATMRGTETHHVLRVVPAGSDISGPALTYVATPNEIYVFTGVDTKNPDWRRDVLDKTFVLKDPIADAQEAA